LAATRSWSAGVRCQALPSRPAGSRVNVSTTQVLHVSD
jgi:hypothetical protein